MRIMKNGMIVVDIVNNNCNDVAEVYDEKVCNFGIVSVDKKEKKTSAFATDIANVMMTTALHNSFKID